MITQFSTGMSPSRIPKVSVYIPEELKKDLELLANKQTRSLSNLINVLLQKAVDEAKANGEIQ